MSLVSAFLVLVLAATPAAAAPPIVVEVTDAAVPFEPHELEAALRVRLPAGGEPVHVRVSAAIDGVRVEARGSARHVPLGTLRGEAAARLVALAANDLLLDDLAATVMPAEPARAVRRDDGLRIGMLGGAALWSDALGGVALDVSRSRGGWGFAIEIGASELLAGPLSLRAGIARASVGIELAGVELRAGAVVAPLFVDDGVGDRTVLAGGTASARTRFPFGDHRVRAVFGLGIDAFATRTTYLVGGMTTLATPRAAPWFAAGLEVTP